MLIHIFRLSSASSSLEPVTHRLGYHVGRAAARPARVVPSGGRFAPTLSLTSRHPLMSYLHPDGLCFSDRPHAWLAYLFPPLRV